MGFKLAASLFGGGLTSTTVAQFIAKAVELNDDTANLTSYNTGHFGKCSIIVSELIRLHIGTQPVQFTVEVESDYSHAYTSLYGKPVAMPTALTEQDQVLSIYPHFQDNWPCTFETVDDVLYLLVPDDFYGVVSATYNVTTPTFTALTDVLPISDAAVNMVASFGLANLIAVAAGDTVHANAYDDAYTKAKRNWGSSNKSPISTVIDVYNY